MAIRRLSKRFACTDAFALAFSEGYLEVVEGTFMPDTFGVAYITGNGTPAVAVTNGIALAVGQPLNVGPRTQRGAGFRLNELYFANTVSGSNGFVNFVGLVEDGVA